MTAQSAGGASAALVSDEAPEAAVVWVTGRSAWPPPPPPLVGSLAGVLVLGGVDVGGAGSSDVLDGGALGPSLPPLPPPLLLGAVVGVVVGGADGVAVTGTSPVGVTLGALVAATVVAPGTLGSSGSPGS